MSGHATASQPRSAESSNERRPHLLLSLLGVQHKPVEYAMGEATHRAEAAPLALLALLPPEERPDEILLLCTPEAKAANTDLVPAFGDYAPTEVLEVFTDPGEEGIRKFLAGVAERIPDGAELTLDLTHGFRHLSFLLYTTLLYLTALREVQIRAAYYAYGAPGEVSPFHDLRPLLELPLWFHALKAFTDTGSARAIARLLATPDGESGKPRGAGRQIAHDLRVISEAYLSALPLEYGYRARCFLDHQARALRRELRARHLPLASELAVLLTEPLERLALPESPKKNEGGAWKSGLRCTREELDRQARMIDDLFERDHTAAAIGLLNEWLVTWVVLQQGDAERWLDFGTARREAAQVLDNLAAWDSVADAADVPLALGEEERRELATLWARVCDVRNTYAHHGMQGKDTFEKRKVVEDIRKRWRQWREAREAG